MRTIRATLDSMTTTTTTFASPATPQHDSPWHSPVPYLFGGLAAMLGLITFALLILACSYLKLSGHLDNGDRAAEVGDDKPGDSEKDLPVFEEKIVVIMAGDVKPTFLATPMSNRASSFESFGDNNGKSTENKEREKAEIAKKPKEEMGVHDHDQTTTPTMENGEANETQESHETIEQNH